MSRRTRGQWAGTWSGRTSKTSHSARPQTRRLRVEPLEDRRMLAAVVVRNTLNSVNGDTSSINALIANPGADGISLSEAILATNATAGNDAITFAPGIVGGQINTGGFALPTITGNLTIQGPMIVDCWGGFQRAFTIAAGANATITGFEIRNGYSEFGGAIYNSGTLSLINCNLNTNLGYYGGAIYNAPGAQLSATGTVLRYNEAEGHGGAIYNDGTLALSHSRRGYSTYNGFLQGADEKGILENKSANHGGAIYNAGGGVLTVTDVSILWNQAQGLGGGIFNEGTATVNGLIGKTTVGEGFDIYYYSAISYNTGFLQGAGAIFNSGTFKLSGASVLANSGGSGGGASVLNGGTLTIINSTLGKNYGIGIHNGGTVTVTNSNISGTVGVGVRNEATGTLTVNNTIVAASTTGDISNSGTLSGSHNFVGDGSGAGLVGTLTGDPKLQPLEPIYYYFTLPPVTHGPVPFMLPLAGSPLINGGDSSLVPSGVVVDQRGVKRIKQTSVDIGPVEFGADTLTVTTLVDENDHTVDPSFGTGTSLREALAQVADLEPTEEVTIVFAPSVTGTISLVQAPLPKLSYLAGVTIVGPGDDLLTIDGSAVQGYYGGILEMRGTVLTISGLTFANGSAFMGGAIHAAGILTLADCSFVGNSAGGGAGAIYTGGTLVATGCNFELNSADTNGPSSEGGGAILNFGTMSVADCTFTENTAHVGGALHTATRDNFESRVNTSFVTGSTFSGNSAVTDGGAITNDAGQYLARLRVTGSTFYQNTAGDQGGGIYNVGTLTVDSSTLYGNSAANSSASPGAGGGIYIGVYDSFYSSYTTLNNSIVAGSTAGGDVYRHPAVTGTFAGGFNLIGDGSGGLPNTITGNPLLGPLQDNGGPTKTMAPLVGSPVIDRGSYDAYPQPLVAPTGVTLTLLPNSGGMPANTTYIYRVVAVSRWGESLGSTELSITTGSASGSAVQVAWNSVPGATSYKVFGGVQGGRQELFADTAALNATHGGNYPYYGTLPTTNTTAIPELDQRDLARVIGNAIDIGAFERQTPQLTGDYNRNGTVDSADYVLLRKTMGATGVTPFSGADGNGDGVIGADDYNVWRSRFGQTLAPGAGSEVASLAVVEQPAKASEAASPVSAPVTAVPVTLSPATIVESQVAPKVVEALPAADWAAFGGAAASQAVANAYGGKTTRVHEVAPFDDHLLLVLAKERVGRASQASSPVDVEDSDRGYCNADSDQESLINDPLDVVIAEAI